MSARISRVHVKVHDYAISEMFARGGEVFKEAENVAVKIYAKATVRAPMGRYPGAGGLMQSHDEETFQSGRFSTTGVVTNDADYALFVHEGTRAKIDPKPGNMFLVPRNPRITPRSKGGKGPFLALDSVPGQKSNPWLYNAAAEVVLRRYGIRLNRS